MRTIAKALLCAAATVGFSTAANATITWSTNQALGQGQTIQLANSQTVTPGNTLVGYTNQTNTQIDFQSTETIDTQSAGQARIFGDDGLLNNLTFFADNTLLGFGYVEFNLFENGASATATGVTLSGYDADDPSNIFSTFFSLSNGENFFSAITSGGEIITKVSFTTSGGGVTDFRQLRLDVVDNNGNTLPEPSTWAMMLFGFGAAGIALRLSVRASNAPRSY
jgi:hypothetical protein